MSELKPCPFCGSDKLSNAINGCFEPSIACDNCGAYGPNDISKEDAVRMWNLRRPEDALRARIAELEARITELSQAVGLITTLKPTMVMDANHPLDMVREVAEHVTARIAELEAATRWIPVEERLPETFGCFLTLAEDWVEQDYFTPEGHWLSGSNITHWQPLPQPPEAQE